MCWLTHQWGLWRTAEEWGKIILGKVQTIRRLVQHKTCQRCGKTKINYLN